jgi:hypothetical protein
MAIHASERRNESGARGVSVVTLVRADTRYSGAYWVSSAPGGRSNSSGINASYAIA